MTYNEVGIKLVLTDCMFSSDGEHVKLSFISHRGMVHGTSSIDEETEVNGGVASLESG